MDINNLTTADVEAVENENWEFLDTEAKLIHLLREIQALRRHEDRIIDLFGKLVGA